MQSLTKRSNMKTKTSKSENNKPLNKQVLKKRVAELENRLNNLHILVSNLAHNQEMIVKALTPDEVDEPTQFEDVE